MANEAPAAGGAAREDAAAVPFESPRFWRWTALFLGVLAFGKGIREPNQWSYTQAQLDYGVGFMRRGLFGALLDRPLGLGHYTHFAVTATVLLLTLYGVLALLAGKAELGRRAPPGELLAVFASSYSVTYLAHLNGYMDVPLALLCCLPLLPRTTGARLAAAIPCAVTGILIHEQFFFAFVPLLVVSVLLGAASEDGRERRLAWAGGVSLLVLGVTGMLLLARHGSIAPARMPELQAQLSARADRPLELEVFRVLPRTPAENLAIMRTVWMRRTFWPAQIESLLIFLPTTAVLCWASLVLLRQWRPRDYRWLFAGVLAASFAPLSLHLFGWDKNRWNELLCLNAFLMLVLVGRQFGGMPAQMPASLRRACLLAMLLNMATGGGMLDYRHIRPYPFLRSPDQASDRTSAQGSGAPAAAGEAGATP